MDTLRNSTDVNPQPLSCILDNHYYVLFLFGITSNRPCISVWNSNQGTPMNWDDWYYIYMHIYTHNFGIGTTIAILLS